MKLPFAFHLLKLVHRVHLRRGTFGGNLRFSRSSLETRATGEVLPHLRCFHSLIGKVVKQECDFVLHLNLHVSIYLKTANLQSHLEIINLTNMLDFEAHDSKTYLVLYTLE